MPNSCFVDYQFENVKSPDLTINIKKSFPKKILDSEIIFSSELLIKSSGVKQDYYWTLNKKEDIYSIFLYQIDNTLLFVLQFNFNEKNWILYSSKNENVDPIFYPLGLLTFNYFLLPRRALIVHASGINYKGKGYLFSGFSGVGKTTISKLFKKQKAEIINDDRIILRKTGNIFQMYNVPLKRKMKRRKQILSKIFILSHSKKNIIEHLGKSQSLAEMLPFVVQHNCDRDFVQYHFDAISDLVRNIEVSKLGFFPDEEIINFISENG